MWKYLNAARAYCQHAVTKNIMKPYNFSSNYRNNASDAYIKRPMQKKIFLKRTNMTKKIQQKPWGQKYPKNTIKVHRWPNNCVAEKQQNLQSKNTWCLFLRDMEDNRQYAIYKENRKIQVWYGQQQNRNWTGYCWGGPGSDVMHNNTHNKDTAFSILYYDIIVYVQCYVAIGNKYDWWRPFTRSKYF